MQVKTKRFGIIEADDEHFIHFRDGMVGMSALKKYILVESPSFPLILWLQSCEDAGIAFPVVEPYFFKRDYKVQMTDADKASLKFQEGDRIKHFVVLTIPENLEGMTVNMKAPVAINLEKGTGAQVILQEKTYEVRHPAYNDFVEAIRAISDESTDEVRENIEENWSPVSISRSRAEVSASV
jgi:flagellar assembly factor FliW